MALERDKQAATSPRDKAEELELALRLERERQLRRAKLAPGRATLVDDRVGGVHDFRGEAMADVFAAVGAVARGERGAARLQAATPAAQATVAQTMTRVAEARAHTLYRRAVDDGAIDANDPVVDETLRARGGGQALPDELRRALELELGVELTRVRVHTDRIANEAARAVNAQAFTVGEDIFFGAGHYDPDSASGRRLLAHELAHVVQHWQGRSATTGGAHHDVSRPGDALEHEAEAVAERVSEGLALSRRVADEQARAARRAAQPVARGTQPHDRVVAPPAGPLARGSHASIAGTPIRPIAMAPSAAPVGPGAVLLRKPESAAEGRPPVDPKTGKRSSIAPMSVKHDLAKVHELHREAKAAEPDTKHAPAQFKHMAKNAVQGAHDQLKGAVQHAAKHPTGAAAAAQHGEHARDHAKHREELRAHAARHGAQAHHVDHGAHHGGHDAGHHDGANPSAHDGVDGIQFKPISSWDKYMPKALPDQDPREKKRIQGLVQKQIEGDRKQSAAAVAKLKAGQAKAAASVRALKPGLTSAIQSAQQAALGKIAAAESAQAAAVQSHIAGVIAAVRGTAAAMKQQVTAAHQQTVSAINQHAQQSKQQLQQAHAQALAKLAQQETTQHTAVTAAFTGAKGQITALGAAKASQASALPDSIALPYDGDKLDAAKKAAHDVGSKYAEAMPEQASKAASDLGGHEPECQQGVSDITTQIKEKLEEAFTQANQGIDQTQQKSIEAADKVKEGSLQQIEQTATTTCTALQTLSTQSVAGIHQQAASAKRGAIQQGQQAIKGVGEGVDKASAGILKGGKGLADGAKGIEHADPAHTQQMVAKAGKDLEQSVKGITSGLHKNVADASSGLAKTAEGAASGIASAAQQAMQGADQQAQQAQAQLQQMGQGAVQTLQKTQQDATKQLTKMVEDGTKGFTALTEAQAKAYSDMSTKLKSGLDGAVKNVGDSFDKAVPAKETEDILANAKKAADAVKPWWQRALAFVVSIVVAVVVVIAVTALIAVSGPVGMILVGALAGALSTVLSTMASNLILGNGLFDGITLESVALGALGGAIGGGITGAITKGALGTTIARTMTFEAGGVAGLGGFAIRTGINTTVGMISDAGAQLIVTGKYEFSMQYFMTTLLSSAVMSTRQFDSASKRLGDQVRTSVGLDPLHIDVNPGSSGTSERVGGPASTSSSSSSPSSSGPHANNAGGERAPAPAPARDPAAPGGHPNGPNPAGDRAPAPAPANDNHAPSAPTGDHPAPATPAPEHPTPAPAAPERPNAPAGDHPTAPAPERPNAPGGDHPAAPGGDHPAPAAPTTNEHPTAPTGDHPTAPTGDHPTAPAGDHPTAPAGEHPTAPAGEHPNAPAGDQPGAQPDHPATNERPADPAAPGGDEHAASPTDTALANDGYDAVSPENRTKVEQELRSGQEPKPDELRDTEANRRGLEELHEDMANMTPEEKAAFEADLADRLAAKNEPTGNLEEDVNAVKRQQQLEQEAENTGALAPDDATHVPGNDNHLGDGHVTLEDFAGGTISDEAKAAAHEQQLHEDGMTLQEQADSILNGKARTQEEMLAAIAQGDAPRYLARVGEAEGFNKYGSFGRDRDFIYAAEPSDLRGRTPAEALEMVGWTPDSIHDMIGKEIGIAVLDTSKPVTGPDGVAHTATSGRMEWPQLTERALNDPKFLAGADNLGVPRDQLPAIFDLMARTPVSRDYVRAYTEADPHLGANAAKVRELINTEYSANPLYTGMGATMNGEGALGVREVMLSNNGTKFKLTPENSTVVKIGVLTEADYNNLIARNAAKAGGGGGAAPPAPPSPP